MSGISCPNCHSTEELNLDDQNLHGMFECLDCGSIWDEKHRAKSEWMPIETAPKDGDWLLLLKKNCVPLVGRWLIPTPYQKENDEFEGCWLGEQSDNLHQLKEYRIGNTQYLPDFWMHLPKEPES